MGWENSTGKGDTVVCEKKKEKEKEEKNNK
jgi:hypothetical protein